MTTPKKILVYHLASLGDILVALPALRLIRREYQDYEITILTPKHKHNNHGAVDIKQVLDGMSLVDSYLYLDLNDGKIKRYLETFKHIRGKGFSVLIYLNEGRELRRVIRDLIYFKLCGVKKIIGTGLSRNIRYPTLRKSGKSESIREFLVRKIEQVGSIDSNSFDAYGINADSIVEYPWIEKNLVKKIIGQDKSKIIGISIGTKIKVNDWGSDKWVELMRIISINYPEYLIVAIGGLNDRAKIDNIFKDINSNYINFCGDITISQSSFVLSKCQIFICHDSGPMHLASAIGVKTVSIFSSRNAPGLWFPAGKTSKVLYTRIECEGCGKTECISLKKKCISSISPNSVFREVKKLVKLSNNI